jgi:prepilin-type N-terminal cleavage/methylation domain-containing protein
MGKHGFTLIELIVAIAISSIIIIPITTMLVALNTTFSASERLSTAQAYSNMAMVIVTRELSTATSSSLSNVLTSTIGKKYLYTIDGIIYLRTVTDTIDERQILRKPDLNNLNMKCNLSFESNGGKSVSVTITILDKTSGSIIFKLSSIVFMQNTPYGITVAVSPGSVVEYSVPAQT